MPVIGIVDDRDDVRKIMSTKVSLALSEGWEVVDTPPLEHLDHYPSWISQHEVVVLIVDERLNEVVIDTGASVSYEGHNLVDYLRLHLPEFPIFVVTSWQDDAELRDRFRQVEDIIDRNLFYDSNKDYMPRITRAGQRYLQAFEEELAELADYAKKSALGESISAEERDHAKAIQTKLETAFPPENIATRSEWLSRMETLKGELEKLKIDIEDQIGDNP